MAITEKKYIDLTGLKYYHDAFNTILDGKFTDNTEAIDLVASNLSKHITTSGESFVAINSDISNIKKDYLKLTGGTLTGSLIAPSNKYYASADEYGIDMKNSDIIGVNSIYTADVSEDTEGIFFMRTDGSYDRISAKDGDFQFKIKTNKSGVGGTLKKVSFEGHGTHLGDITSDRAANKVLKRNSNDDGYVWANDNNNTYSAGTGITKSTTGSSSGSFSVDFGGNGSSNKVSRSDHTHSYLPDTTTYAGSTSIGGPANAIKTESASGNSDRPIFFNYASDSTHTKVVYNDNFQYNPDANHCELSIGKGSSHASVKLTDHSYINYDSTEEAIVFNFI